MEAKLGTKCNQLGVDLADLSNLTVEIVQGCKFPLHDLGPVDFYSRHGRGARLGSGSPQTVDESVTRGPSIIDPTE